MSNILTNNINPRSGNVINIGGVNDTVSIAGTVTYEDVTSVDSIGVVTARSGLNVVGGGITAVGVITSYSGIHVGAGVSAVGIITAQSGVEFGTVGSGVTISAVGADTSLGFLVNGSERVRIDSSGRFGIGTNGPASKLHVANSSSAEIELILDPGPSSSEVAYINSYRTNAPLGFKAGDTERMRIDADGRLLVGTSSTPPANTADVFIKGGTGSGGAGGLTITRTNSTPADNNSLGNIYFSDSNGTPACWIHSQRDGGTWTSGSSQPSRLVFATTADGASSPTERMRIDRIGDVRARAFTTDKGSIGTPGGIMTYDPGADRYVFINYSGLTYAGVSLAPGATSWGVYSDERLKDIIEPIEGGLNKVASIRAVIGKYKTDNDETRRAFLIAQDVQAVLPEAVGVDETDNAYLDLRYTEVIPLLVSALKESKDRIEALEARISQLEGN